MLSRGNSDGATRLRRAKSTSSVPKLKSAGASSTVPDLTSTYRNAKTAAARAFGAAYGTPADQVSCVSGGRSMAGRKAKSEGQGSHFARKREMAGKQLATSPKQRKTWNSPRAENLRHATGSAASMSGSGYQQQSYGIVHSPALVSDQQPDQMAYEHTRKWEAMQPATMAEALQNPAMSDLPAPNGLQLPPNPIAGYQYHDLDQVDAGSKVDAAVHAESQEKIQQLRSLMSMSFPPSENKENNENNDRNEVSLDQTHRDGKFEGGDHGLGRKFNTLKRRLSRLPASLRSSYRSRTGRSMSAQEQLPVQQMSAHRPHHISSTRPIASGIDGHTCEDYATGGIDRIGFEPRPPTPPVHGTRPRNVTRSHHAEETQIDDVDGLSHGGSRLTSWTNSSGANTVVTRVPTFPLPPSERIASNEVEMPTNSKNPSSVIRRLRVSRRSKSSISADNTEVEPQRMYSALVRSIGSINRQKSTTLPPTIEAKDNVRRDEDADEAASGRASKSTIRLVPDGSHDRGEQKHTTLVSDCLRIPVSVDRGVMSPSVYSFRPYDNASGAQMSNLSLPERVFSQTGTAMVSESQPFTTWSLDVSPKAQARPNTSADWRAWTSQAVANIEPSGDYASTLLPHERRMHSITHPRRSSMSSSEASSDEDDSEPEDQEPVPRVIGLRERLANRLDSNSSGNARPRQVSRRVERVAAADPGQMSELQEELAQLSQMLQRQDRHEPARRDASMPTYLNESMLPSQNFKSKESEASVTHATKSRMQKASRVRPDTDKRASTTERSRRFVPERESRRRRIMEQPATVNESFLHDIRKGPYLPYDVKSSPTRSVASLNAAITPPRFARNDENATPSSGQRMADLFLKARMKEQALAERSPSAFL